MSSKFLSAFFIALFFIGANMHAQTIYLLKYDYTNDDGRTDYRAFLVRYDDGTGFIRVAFTDSATGKHNLVSMDMEESYEKKEKSEELDSNILYFEGYNTEVIKGDTGKDYEPDIFEFHRAKGSQYYDPYDVFYFSKDDDDNNKDDEETIVDGNFSDIQLLEKKDLTKEFVSEFFTEKDDFYQNLFETVTRPLTGDQQAATLHLIIVANTNDPSIGSTCVLDKDRTKQTFSDLAEFMKINFDVKTIFGDNYSKQSVQDAINALNPSAKDIVVFYYSGHGFSKTDSYQFPYIELRAKQFQGLDDNSLNIQDIYDQIKKKGAKFSLVFSDCCNTLPGTPEGTSGNIAVTRSSSIGWSLNNCARLFFPDKPTAILMTAATKGEMSAGNNNYGGFFTYNFRASLTDFLSPLHDYSKVSWDELIADAKAQTINKANHTMCGDIKCAQHPVFEIQ